MCTLLPDLPGESEVASLRVPGPSGHRGAMIMARFVNAWFLPRQCMCAPRENGIGEP